MKKILRSAFVAVFALAMIGVGTSAFFSDIETSAGNILRAGDIDLLVGNTAYYNGSLIEEGDDRGMTWELGDIEAGEYFFNLLDLKPGDWEEDTIELVVESNDAYLCANVNITENLDNSITEPEDEAISTPGDENDGTEGGDLAEELNFIFWADDGDNVLEDGENVFLEGPASNVLGGGTLALIDSDDNVFDNQAVMVGGQSYFIGKAFCYGTLTQTPVAPGQNSPTNQETGPGFQCDGESVTNLSQTDSLGGTLSFYATQSRNNNTFQCSDDLFDDGEEEVLVGAALGGYSGPAPESCDLTVDDSGGANHTTIQAAVDAASDDETVCVEDGTYDETVNITVEGLTLAAVNGPLNSATIDGGVIIDAADVEVTGFIVIPGNTEGSLAGFYLKEPADNAEISYNEINATGLVNPIGIVNVTGTSLPGVWIHHNYIHGPMTSGSGIYTNPHTGLWNIEHNDIDNFLAGIGQWNGANVMYNEFEHDTLGSEAIGVDSTWEAVGGVVNYNNFLDDTELNAYGAITGTIDAEHNFWSTSAAAQVSEPSADVDTDPEAVSAYPHN